MSYLKTEVYGLKADDLSVSLVCYSAGTSKEIPFNEKRKAVLIIPGGGYSFCSDREAEPLAFSFLAKGFNAFVLFYSLKEKSKWPAPLIDASLAVKFIKDNAEEFRIDPDYIFAIGFSAGGHLAGALGTMWHEKEIYDAIDMPYGYNKVRGVILAYPVIDAGRYAHRGSIDNITGMDHSENASEDTLDAVSIHKHVDGRTVPMFVWHTATDTTVPVQNSLLLCHALADNKIPFELRVYPEGGHGFSLATDVVCSGVRTEDPYVAGWFEDSVRFIKKL